jgi:GT2 family glycosyltransferase
MLGIIIVNYNDWDNLRSCINSIEINIPYKIYVVDNASKPNSYSEELLRNKNIVFIKSEINGGYSFGNNLGLSQSVIDGCDLFLISNTDIIFNSDSINKLIKPLQKRECDVVGPKVNLPFGKTQEEILGVRINPLGKIKLIINSASRGTLFKKYKDLFNNKRNPVNNKLQVYGVSGCCFAFNMKTFDKVMPFDENIFLFNEEWLLAEKCIREELKVMVNYNSEVLHLHGSTTKLMKLFSYKCFIKSEIYLLKTVFPRFLVINMFILILRIPKLIIIYIKDKFYSL